MEFSGVPFMVVSQKIFDCQHGVDRNKEAKAKKQIENENEQVNL